MLSPRKTKENNLNWGMYYYMKMRSYLIQTFFKSMNELIYIYDLIVLIKFIDFIFIYFFDYKFLVLKKISIWVSRQILKQIK
jgi:hypothetical protein